MHQHVKKAVSPLIATVLLIAFTILLLALILNWTTKLTKSNLEKIQAEGEFKCLTEVEIEFKGVKDNKPEIENLGGVDIDSFLVRISGGTPQNIKTGVSAYSINIIDVVVSAGQQVSLMPVLKVQGVNIPCSKKAVTIKRALLFASSKTIANTIPTITIKLTDIEK